MRRHALAVVALVGWFCGAVGAQVPGQVAGLLKELGPTIEVPRTAAMYEPLVRRAEPYVGVEVRRDVAYGPAPRHLLDVFASSAGRPGAKPILLFVHGGAFVRGNRRLSATSPFYDNVMLWAADQGLIGISMTYPLAPDSPWPAGAADIGRALTWIQSNAAGMGGNPAQIFLLGHSAGATHVGNYLANESLQPAGRPGVAGALMLSGVYEITAELIAASPTYPQYFGSDPASYPRKSSLEGLLKTDVPLWVAHAEMDPPTFIGQARRLRTALCKLGRCPAGLELAGHTHMSEIFSFNSADQSVAEPVIRFIQGAR